jgi:hypothetical protein
MKRKLFLSLILIIGITLLFGGTPRIYMQRCSLADGSEAPVTNTGYTTSPDYIVRATMIGPATGPETLGTDLGTPVSSLRISRLGTGTDIPYYTGTTLQLGTFPTQHQPGWTIHMYVKYIPTQEVAEWDIIIPPTTNLINIQDPIQVIPPYPVVIQVLTITSDPTGQPIWINGVDSGFTTPHEFENPTVGDVYTINNPAYTWNPPNYTVPEGFTTTTINFVGTPVIVDTWALTVNSTPEGIAIIKDGNPTGQVTPYTFTSSTAVTDLTGIYSLATTTLTGGQFWDPANITVTAEDFVAVPGGKGANLKVASFGSKNGPKTNFAYSISFQMKTCYTLTITGPADAAAVGSTAVTGPAGAVIGNIPITLIDNNDNINDLVGTYTIAALPTTVDAFPDGVRKHWIQNPKTVTEAMFVNDVATLEFQWRNYISRWYVPAIPGMPDAHLFFVPIDDPTNPIDYGILPITLYYYGTITKDNYGEWRSPDEGNYYAAPEEDFDPEEPPAPPLNNPGPQVEDKISYTLTIQAYDSVTDAYVNVTLTINGVPTSAATTPYTCIDPAAGIVFSIDDPTHLYTWTPVNYTVPVGGLTDNTTITFTLSPYSPPLPVELTSFTAVLTNDFYVQLNWVSQTETNLSGYRVYRNEENTLTNAILITPTMIPATNTSQEHIYTVEDREVENNATYYYWLESVDFNNSQFHGPVIVVLEGNVPPVMPEITTLKNAYPNPFRANNSTNIEVAIKAGETGTLTIYNIMGQVVKTYKVTEGIHTIQWNGRDGQGNICGSGIYFYKLTTPSLNQTKKMVIVK